MREFPRSGLPILLGHAEYATVEVKNDEIGVTLHRVDVDRRELERAALDSMIPMRAELTAAYS